ncbi:MAG: zf-HC2 domain-containing protein [Chloroflexota bacterium]|nr:zf-HC2 domain-containing protein [Chloroflexota bacterium]
MSLIDCREAVTRMWAYLSQGLAKQDAEELETHLGVCQRCCGELEFSRELRERVAGVGPEQIPPSVRDRINELLTKNAGQPGEPS